MAAGGGAGEYNTWSKQYWGMRKMPSEELNVSREAPAVPSKLSPRQRPNEALKICWPLLLMCFVLQILDVGEVG